MSIPQMVSRLQQSQRNLRPNCIHWLWLSPNSHYNIDSFGGQEVTLAQNCTARQLQHEHLSLQGFNSLARSHPFFGRER
jgi:hypothetical protein